MWTHADDVLRAEDAAARAVAGPVRGLLDEILTTFALRWVREFGPLANRAQQSGPAFVAFMTDLGAALSSVTTAEATTAILAAATAANQLGRRQAYIEAGLEPVEIRATALDLRTIDYAHGVAGSAQALIDRSALLAGTVRGGSFAAVTRTVSVARQGANQLDRAARTVTNEQVNHGIAMVSADLGADKLWIAERDACVHCLALSGHVVGVDAEFDANLTFGARPLSWAPEDGLAGPPRHPRCRCRVTPWFGHDQDGAESITHDWAGAIADARARGDEVGVRAAHQAAAAARASSAVDLPASLRREAERSVLNGWALPSEPTSVRAQAADRLLRRIAGNDGRAPSGWHVPASVRKGAARDIRKGTFRKRAFPA